MIDPKRRVLIYLKIKERKVRATPSECYYPNQNKIFALQEHENKISMVHLY